MTQEGTVVSPGTADDLGPILPGLRSGDESSFVALYRLLHPRLLRYAATLVGNEAEDVVSEAWLQISRDVTRFDGEARGLRAWIVTVVRNRCLDHLRAQSRRPVVLDDVLAAVDSPGTHDTASQAMESLGTARAVALVAGLPREQAEAVMLRAVLGLDVAQCALVLGKEPGAVRVAAHRGLRRLAAELERTSGS